MTYATGLVPALRGVATALTAAGVPASLSRNTMRIPGAWLRPDTVGPAESLAAGGTARVSVLLAAPQADDEEALGDLTELLAKALAVLTPEEDVDTSVVLTVRNNPQPAFRLVVDLEY